MPDVTEQCLCRLAEVPDTGALTVALSDGKSVILIRQKDQQHAYSNVCPHAGRRLDWAPGKFLIKRGVMTCAAHGASFDVADGTCLGGPCRGEGLQTVPIRVVDDVVWLD